MKSSPITCVVQEESGKLGTVCGDQGLAQSE
jgi:hypothetical protein